MKFKEEIIDFIRLGRIAFLRFALSNTFELYAEKTLILAPHPDDEVIGVAGLIQHLLSKGKRVEVVIMTGGGKSHSGCCKIEEQELIKARRDLSRKAAEILGLPQNDLHFLDYPDGGIAYNHPETERLKTFITEIKPDTIFVPHHGEGWSDHIQTREIGLKLADAHISVYEYCVWFWYYNTWKIDWKSARILKMTQEEYVLKNKAIDTYVLPQAPCGKPWSGVLPKIFVQANRWNKELYFRIK